MAVKDVDCFIVNGVIHDNVRLFVCNQKMAPMAVFENLTRIETHLLERKEPVVEDRENLKTVGESDGHEESKRMHCDANRLLLEVLIEDAFLLRILRLEVVPDFD